MPLYPEFVFLQFLQATQYMSLISKEMQPVAGTEGAFYRRRRLMRQLPLYDQDPSHCRGLSENEIKLMEEFIKQYKDNALGVGEVALLGQGGATKEEGKPSDKNTPASKEAASTNGTLGHLSKGQDLVSPQHSVSEFGENAFFFKKKYIINGCSMDIQI